MTRRRLGPLDRVGQPYACLTVLLVFASFGTGPASLSAQDRPPLRLEQVVQLIESDVFTEERVFFLADQACLAFQVNPLTEATLRQAGASEQLIDDLRGVCLSLLVSVDPPGLDLAVGDSAILSASAFDPDSAAVSPVFFQWTSENSAVVEVRDDGVVIGRATGQARVFARVDGGPEAAAFVRVSETGPVTVAEVSGGKSVATAAVLGVVPGGGEFYVGNTAKGAVVFGGVAAALAAGFLLSGEDTLSVTRVLQAAPDCTGTACQYQVETTAELEEKNYWVVGVAVAGAFWLYGLVDGIIAAKKSQVAPPVQGSERDQGLSLQIAPPDGIRVTRQGAAEFTLIRIRS